MQALKGRSNLRARDCFDAVNRRLAMTEMVLMSDCLFCKIIKKEIPAKIAYEDNLITAIHDINPQAPGHILIMPKKHIDKIADISEDEIPLIGRVIDRAKSIAAKNEWKDYRLVFNNGAGAGQSVFHIHLHLLAGRPMAWPPG